MNWVDVGIAIILAAFALNGLTKGLLRQLTSLAGFALGLLLATALYPSVARRLGQATASDIALEPFAFVVIFLSIWVLANLVGFWAHRRSAAQQDDWVDDLGGTLLGLATGWLLLSVLAVVAVQWRLGAAHAIEASRLGAWLLASAAQGARLLSRWMPLPWLP